MRDRSGDLSHHEWTLYHGATSHSISKEGKEGKVLFNDALNTFLFTVIWRQSISEDDMLHKPKIRNLCRRPLDFRHRLLFLIAFTILCPTPYNRKENVMSASLNKTFPSYLYLLWVVPKLTSSSAL